MFMDWIIDEDVQRFLEWGIEGEHYIYNDSGRIERTQEQRILQSAHPDNDILGRYLRNLMPKLQGTYSDGNPTDHNESPEEYFAALNDYDKVLFTKLGIQTQSGLMRSEVLERPVFYSFRTMDMDEETPEYQTIRRLEALRVRYLPRMIGARADRFDRFWDEYANAVSAVDQQPVFDFINEQIAAREAAFSR